MMLQRKAGTGDAERVGKVVKVMCWETQCMGLKPHFISYSAHRTIC